MNLGEKLQYTYSTLFFDNLFTSPMLVTKLREKKRIYGTGIVQNDRKNIIKMKTDDFQLWNNVVAIKCDNFNGTLMSTNI